MANSPMECMQQHCRSQKMQKEEKGLFSSSVSFPLSHLHHYKVDISAENCWVSFLSRALLLVCDGWERQTWSLLLFLFRHTASCITEQLDPNNHYEQKNVVICVTSFLLFALFLYFKLEMAEARQGWTYIQLVIFPPILCCSQTAVPTLKNSRKWRCDNWADIEDVIHKNGREWWQG